MSSRAQGVFIVFEGGDGSGKSTQAALLAGRLRAESYDVCLTAEPGGTALGRTVKAVFERQAANGEPALAPTAEMLLFQAARAENVRSVIRPALEEGRVVLCDRFTDSTLAYQGYGRGLDLDEIRRCNEIASGGLEPDLVLFFDVPPEVGLRRADTGAGAKNRDSIGQEALGFHRRVREGFLALAVDSGGRTVVIDATQPEGVVAGLAWDAVRQLLARSAARVL